MEDQIGQFIRLNITWAKLPPTVQQVIGTPEEYDKKIVEYSVRNQLRYRGNLVRHIKKNEKVYYEQLLKYSREHLMLFPYHLSDFIVTAMRMTPFQYYIGIMTDLLDQEKSYDTLPNFAAADCLRLLGIGRNQYIEIMNQCRSSKKFLSMIRKPPRELLPSKPVKDIPLEPWWQVNPGYITEDDVKLMVTPAEKDIVDKIIDGSNTSGLRAGNFNENDVRSLYLKGLIYLEVPIEDDDLIVVPPLEGFVMNRVTGDYFETLLYKIFISIDENTTVNELASMLQIDLSLVKNVVSMYCRLGFAYKKGLDMNSDDYHPSWRKARTESEANNPQNSTLNRRKSLVNFFDALTDDRRTGSLVEENSVDLSDSVESPTHGEETSISSTSKEADKLFNGGQSTPSAGKRIALLYDSTLAAFLMMGNLSPGLKSHAVTMFEVGKLPDESLDSLLAELSKISNITEDEGTEAERYFLNAVMLYKTINFLRYNKQLATSDKSDNSFEGTKGSGLDLLRCESLQNLDPQTCQRLLMKNYKLMISIAPFSKETKLLKCNNLPHLGPPCPAVISPWFKLYIYHKTNSGPPSLLLAKGSRISHLPNELSNFDHFLVSPWGRDAATIQASSALFAINEALTHSALLIQGFSSNNILDEDQLVHIPFPRPSNVHNVQGDGGDEEVGQMEARKNPFEDHEDVVKLSNSLQLDKMVGYVSLLNLSDDGHGENWTIFDCHFGVPLFERVLNKDVSDMIVATYLASSSIQELEEACASLCLDLDAFVERFERPRAQTLAGLDMDSKHHYNFPATSASEALPSANLLCVAGHFEQWPRQLVS